MRDRSWPASWLQLLTAYHVIAQENRGLAGSSGFSGLSGFV